MHSHCGTNDSVFRGLYGLLDTRVETRCPGVVSIYPAWLATLVIFRTLKSIFFILKYSWSFLYIVEWELNKYKKMNDIKFCLKEKLIRMKKG